ncbi:SDR family oxidoreductase [Mycolicibacterium phlei]|jgi:NAD(P)-dependent dehydrogenase (short-subunit alcohol dehydrogenase family)|uniref:NAD-dependent epimerase n=1 Tax=Mycolicibacterium phlei DSM 43239 = CCUG 21000 TaxID=1226750 RepID=A0A5N5USM7_MYCPH|nr:SDR family oxidoreductase [Mycolicibacterium phlei]EID13269.1 3-alpha-hydroxysteroid dehydrogenase [Mycolicibacterium phlei RIVM601174]KAB7751499.1 NAD-dependent epimerase [Mycolicibacterium phlei DSM 43239 = CCUG 21000]KXW68140.1 NAD-dependent epimerase [Mycolicibacterium phlei DSM 43239 = CCUG 21000]KXW76478.1 NAD-dependent epimerase [Mycolicibacterium phlei DSM 43071]MBF4193337.1 3-alpha-hydroxysteroid dehydrogenase [Mycolicibacterium phlei]
MGVYVVSGSSSGMGLQAAEKLRAAGHTVIGVDVKAGEGEVKADLSSHAGRRQAVVDIVAAAGNRLDGAVLAAGIGPTPGPDSVRRIFEINYFGVVEVLRPLQPLLAAADRAKVVVIGSNSTTTTPAVPRRTVRALLAGDIDKAVRSLRLLGPVAPSLAYAASKIAVSHWVRRTAVTREWAGAGIRLNALAPGAIMTPLLEQQLKDPQQAKAVNAFPVPIGGFGDPGQLADWMLFMLSDSADFLCGSVIFVDGGSDAYFRSRDWPNSVPVRKLPAYLWRFARG